MTTLGPWAFAGCTEMTNITLGKGLTNIGSLAFLNCQNLRRIALPRGLTSLQTAALSGCIRLTSIAVDPSNLDFADRDGVLFDKQQTVLLVYPNGRLGKYAVPDGVARIGRGAFGSASRVSRLFIPNSMANIEEGALAAGPNLRKIIVAPLNPRYCDVNGVLFDKAKSTLFQYPSGRAGTYRIPQGVTAIGGFAFQGCNSLTGLTVPRSVTSIGFLAFEPCDSLASLYFMGNAPLLEQPLGVTGDANLIVYRRQDTTGWETNGWGRPIRVWNQQVAPAPKASPGGRIIPGSPSLERPT